MKKRNEILVIENRNRFSLIVPPFSSARFSYTLLYLFLFYNAFFFFPYVMSDGTFALFPIFFLFLSRFAYIIGKKVFKTHFSISDKYLSLERKPFSILKRKQIPISKIKQIFICEASHPTYGKVYQLRALVRGDRDIVFLELQKNRYEFLRDLEERMEHFMGIVDQPVSKEVIKPFKYISIQAKKVQARILPEQPEVWHLKEEDFVDYGGYAYQVSHQVQYDWYNWSSTKLVQMLNFKYEECLLYINQKGSEAVKCVEQRLKLDEIKNINFNPYDPFVKTRYKEETYVFNVYQKGNAFSDNGKNAQKVRQWIYTNQSKNAYLRVLLTENGTQHLFYGEKDEQFLRKLNSVK